VLLVDYPWGNLQKSFYSYSTVKHCKADFKLGRNKIQINKRVIILLLKGLLETVLGGSIDRDTNKSDLNNEPALFIN